jgi:RNA polymerase sigma factor (sigma-70 family)
VLDRPKPTRRELRNASDKELLRLWRDEKSFAAREVLVERYQGLVRSIAGQFGPRSHDFDDYVQVGNVWGLLPAIDECKPMRALSSYARTAIYRAIRDYKNETEGPVYRPTD